MPASRARRKTVDVSFFSFQDVMTSVVGIFILIILIMVLQLVGSVARSQKSSGAISQDLLDSLATLELEVNRMQKRYDELQKNQSLTADVNLFNVNQRTAEMKSQLQDLEDRISRSNSQTQSLSQSLVAAQVMHQAAMSDSLAAESDRQQLEQMLRQLERIQKISNVLETDHPVIFKDQTAEGRFLVLVRLEAGKIHLFDSSVPTSAVYAGPSRHRQFKTWLQSQSLGKLQFFLVVKPTGADDYEEVAEALQKGGAMYGFDVAEEQVTFVLKSQLESGL
jgi:hypothetical protein